MDKKRVGNDKKETKREKKGLHKKKKIATKQKNARTTNAGLYFQKNTPNFFFDCIPSFLPPPSLFLHFLSLNR